ncbi:hypothetical protein SynBIOSE41_03693 [Synechococcus sp. BIOS-E4-1]|nr:hypothetical protein SynBIOSE41_03693 [Synechococcus sp. BIOS-E4-1]
MIFGWSSIKSYTYKSKLSSNPSTLCCSWSWQDPDQQARPTGLAPSGGSSCSEKQGVTRNLDQREYPYRAATPLIQPVSSLSAKKQTRPRTQGAPKEAASQPKSISQISVVDAQTDPQEVARYRQLLKEISSMRDIHSRLNS